MGPLHTKSAVKEYLEGIAEIKKQGGNILYGGELYQGVANGGANATTFSLLLSRSIRTLKSLRLSYSFLSATSLSLRLSKRLSKLTTVFLKDCHLAFSLRIFKTTSDGWVHLAQTAAL